MRNFVKVLLVGTVLAGACVLLPNDSWSELLPPPGVIPGYVGKDGKIKGTDLVWKGWEKRSDGSIRVVVADSDGRETFFDATRSARVPFRDLLEVAVAKHRRTVAESAPTVQQPATTPGINALDQALDELLAEESPAATNNNSAERRRTGLEILDDILQGKDPNSFWRKETITDASGKTRDVEVYVNSDSYRVEFTDESGELKSMEIDSMMPPTPENLKWIVDRLGSTGDSSPTEGSGVVTPAAPVVETTAAQKMALAAEVEGKAERAQMEAEWNDMFGEGGFPDRGGPGGALLVDPMYYSDSVAMNHNNVGVLGNLLGGEDLAFNREGTALGRLVEDIFNGWNDLDPNKGTYSLTAAQQATLRDLYGITFDSATQQISFSGNEGDLGANIVKYMESLSGANNGQGYQSLLQAHAENVAGMRAIESAIEAARAQLDAANTDDEISAAQAALQKAENDRAAAQPELNRTTEEVAGIVAAANAIYDQAFDGAVSALNNVQGLPSEGANAIIQALENDNFAAARDLVDSAYERGAISLEDAENLKNKIAGVEGTKAEAEAKEAEVSKAESTAAGPTETDMTDLLRTAAVVAMPFVTETELALREEVNILAGDIGPAVGVVDDTALSDVPVDASMPSSSVAGAAAVVQQLLRNAQVNLNLLDETFEEAPPPAPEEPEEPEGPAIQAGGLAGAGSQAGTSADVEVPEVPEEPEEPDADANADADAGAGAGAESEDGKKYLTDEQVNEIQKRRHTLLKQYVNAAVQISEGMNAISNKFVDRANQLISFSEGVQNEAGVFGLTQDVGRYVLLESLRAVALSSAQMGVQAARLLNEQEVDNEIK